MLCFRSISHVCVFICVNINLLFLWAKMSCFIFTILLSFFFFFLFIYFLFLLPFFLMKNSINQKKKLYLSSTQPKQLEDKTDYNTIRTSKEMQIWRNMHYSFFSFASLQTEQNLQHSKELLSSVILLNYHT